MIIFALICFAISYFEHGAGPGSVPRWFDSQGMLLLGLVFVTLHLIWLWHPWQRP